MTDYETCGATTSDGGECELPAGWGATGDSDRCKYHGGASPGNPAPEGNDYAAKAGAWAEDFYEGFLTEAEKERVEKSADILGDEAGAQEIARHAASVCLEQFRRTGDERFMRRYESLCDTFGLAPADEMGLSGELSTEDIVIDFNNVDT